MCPVSDDVITAIVPLDAHCSTFSAKIQTVEGDEQEFQNKCNRASGSRFHRPSDLELQRSHGVRDLASHTSGAREVPRTCFWCGGSNEGTGSQGLGWHSLKMCAEYILNDGAHKGKALFLFEVWWWPQGPLSIFLCTGSPSYVGLCLQPVYQRNLAAVRRIIFARTRGGFIAKQSPFSYSFMQAFGTNIQRFLLVASRGASTHSLQPSATFSVSLFCQFRPIFLV